MKLTVTVSIKDLAEVEEAEPQIWETQEEEDNNLKDLTKENKDHSTKKEEVEEVKVLEEEDSTETDPTLTETDLTLTDQWEEDSRSLATEMKMTKIRLVRTKTGGLTQTTQTMEVEEEEVEVETQLTDSRITTLNKIEVKAEMLIFMKHQEHQEEKVTVK